MVASQRWDDLALRASEVFRPGTPINERDVFSGRREQIRRAVDAVNQVGQHVVIFGERGVGKTSLSRVLRQFLAGFERVTAPSVNCEATDTFQSVWRKVFARIDVARPADPVVGYAAKPRQTDLFRLADLLGDQPVTADLIRDQLESLSRHTLPIIIIDEFDRLSADAAVGFADTIKGLSDYGINATVVLVGVGDTLNQLVRDHQSVDRSLKQIKMPRMTPDEIASILNRGQQSLGMTMTPSALQMVVRLARGLPHYAHLLGLHATRAALDAHSMEIDSQAVRRSIEISIDDAEQTIRTPYHLATQSSKKLSLFGDVLLACALAKSDEFGYFTAPDVREELRRITGKAYDIPNFAQHLSDFCSPKRGTILRREGTTRFKYRFRDPLMQPYVVMQGFRHGRLTPETLSF